MSMVREGSSCVLLAGRRAGEEVTITKVLDDNFVMVRTKKGTERKASVKHLTPSQKKAK